jgi:hypothetical protein
MDFARYCCRHQPRRRLTATKPSKSCERSRSRLSMHHTGLSVIPSGLMPLTFALGRHAFLRCRSLIAKLALTKFSRNACGLGSTDFEGATRSHVRDYLGRSLFP